MQVPPQQPSPSPQGGSQGTSVQLPPWQPWVGPQALLQLPQCSLLVETSVQPSSQHCFGAWHRAAELQAQMPEMHMFPRGVHTCPQPPQWLRSVLVFTQFPPQQVSMLAHDPSSEQGLISPASAMSAASTPSAESTWGSVSPGSGIGVSIGLLPSAQEAPRMMIKP